MSLLVLETFNPNFLPYPAGWIPIMILIALTSQCCLVQLVQVDKRNNGRIELPITRVVETAGNITKKRRHCDVTDVTQEGREIRGGGR